MREDLKGVDDPLASFARFVSEIMGKNVSEWQQSLEPWSKLVDRGFDEVAGSQLLLEIATVATASTAKPDAGAWDEDGFAATKKVVRRLFFARHKGDDVNWWRERLADITIETTCPCLTVLLSWGTPDLITALKDDVDPIIEKLSSHDWSRLLYMASLISRATREISTSISEEWFAATGSLSPRMALILIGRVKDQEAARQLSRGFFVDYAGNDTQILGRAAWDRVGGGERWPNRLGPCTALVKARSSGWSSQAVSDFEDAVVNSARGSGKGGALRLRKPLFRIGGDL